MTPWRRPFLLGACTGAIVGAWAYPLGQILTSIAAGRGLLYPKENQP